MTRISIHGKGQALDGDITTTGAVCIASSTNFRGDNRRALRLGDATTECPNCKKAGVIVEGVNSFVIGGKPAVVDGRWSSVIAQTAATGSSRSQPCTEQAAILLRLHRLPLPPVTRLLHQGKALHRRTPHFPSAHRLYLSLASILCNAACRSSRCFRALARRTALCQWRYCSA